MSKLEIRFYFQSVVLNYCIYKNKSASIREALYEKYCFVHRAVDFGF